MFQKMRRFFSKVGLAVATAGTLAALTGCTSHQPPQPTGSWSQVNNVAPSAAVISTPKRTTTPISISLENAIAQFASPAYRIEIDPDVDMHTVIVYDSSKNWLEALAEGMSDASIEFSANLHKKSGTIKRTTITLAEMIDRLLPNEFTVFSDAALNQEMLLHFDHRKHWIDALNIGAIESGVDLKIDFTQKIIYLKPTNKYRGLSTSISKN